MRHGFVAGHFDVSAQGIARLQQEAFGRGYMGYRLVHSESGVKKTPE